MAPRPTDKGTELASIARELLQRFPSHPSRFVDVWRGWACELTCLRDCTLVNAGRCSVGGDGPASRDDGDRGAGGAQRHRSWYPGGSGEHLVDDDGKSSQVWGKEGSG